MAGRGETVKYYIDADTSGFSRGMAEAAVESDIAGKKIDSSLTKTSKSSENNFKDIRKNAQTAASSIRNFGIAFQAFNTTSLIIGVTALAGAILELSGALAAAGAPLAALPAILTQGGAAAATYQTGVAGLGKAFTALQKGDPEAFKKSLSSLGPAATQVAFAFGGLLKAFNGVRLNTQNALFAGIGDTILNLAAQILPILNAGMQEVGGAINGAFKEAARLANTPLFKGTVSQIFADTAANIKTLTGALGPLFTIFSNLYLVTRPYVALFTQYVVNLTKSLSAYLASARGQAALSLAIQNGVTALKELGSLVGAVFHFLTAVFRTSVDSGVSLIATLTGIVDRMTAWVNSAEGQKGLAALFQFTSLVVNQLADSIGRSLSAFFQIVQVISNLNPHIQALIVNFLATSLTLRPVLSYLSQLYLALRVLVVTIFNVVEQAIVFFTALGAVASVVLVLGAGLLILGNIIRGPLGSAFIIVGGILVTYIGLNWLLGLAANAAAAAMFRKAQAAAVTAQFDSLAAETNILLATTMYTTASAALAAGGGMSIAARGAAILQAALLPLLVLGAGVLVILSMLGLFSGKAKSAQSASTGLGGSLSALQKSLKGVGSTGNKASTGGLSALNDSLNNIGDASAKATGSLASFDKMNVLTDNNAAASGLGAIPGLPSLPDLGSPTVATPQIDTGDFDNALKDMQKQFDGLNKDLSKGLFNPFKSIADFLVAHPGLGLAILVGIILAIAAAFIFLDVAAFPITLTITLIGLAILAIIAIAILLYKNWDTVTAFIKDAAAAVGDFLKGVFQAVGDFIGGVVSAIAGFFKGLWDGIVAVFNVAVGFFTAIFDGIKAAVMFYINIYITAFKLAWEGIKAAFGFAVDFFKSVWEGIKSAFSAVTSFFSDIFKSAYNGITGVFGSLWTWFKTNVWDRIVSVFSSIGTSVADAVSGAFKGVVNTAINAVSGFINTVIGAINSAINVINKIPGVNIGKISTVTLPKLAKGGVVTSSTIANLGENGAEAVVPLENNTEWIDKLANKINAAGGNSNQPLNVTVELDGTKLGQIIIDRINEKTQMSGRNQVLV